MYTTRFAFGAKGDAFGASGPPVDAAASAPASFPRSELAAMPANPTPHPLKNHRRESNRARASWNSSAVFIVGLKAS